MLVIGFKLTAKDFIFNQTQYFEVLVIVIIILKAIKSSCNIGSDVVNFEPFAFNYVQ